MSAFTYLQDHFKNTVNNFGVVAISATLYFVLYTGVEATPRRIRAPCLLCRLVLSYAVWNYWVGRTQATMSWVFG